MRVFMLLCTLVIVLVGCDLLGDTAAWEAVLPDPPAHWDETFPVLEADLVTVGADGTVAVSVVQTSVRRFPVRLRKERNSLVLLYCRTGAADERLRPWGAVFPAQADRGTRTLTLSVTGGFVGERLMRLADRGFPVACFNTERLIALIDEAGGDPWVFDAPLLESRLAEGKFSVYALKPLPARPVALSLPAGEWFSESPLSPLWPVEEGAGPAIADLSYGYHTLYRRGAADRVYVSVAEKEVIVFWP